MRTRIEIVRVQVVSLVQQAVLVHHLHDCFRNEGHFLGGPGIGHFLNFSMDSFGVS